MYSALTRCWLFRLLTPSLALTHAHSCAAWNVNTAVWHLQVWDESIAMMIKWVLWYSGLAIGMKFLVALHMCACVFLCKCRPWLRKVRLRSWWARGAKAAATRTRTVNHIQIYKKQLQPVWRWNQTALECTTIVAIKGGRSSCASPVVQPCGPPQLAVCTLPSLRDKHQVRVLYRLMSVRLDAWVSESVQKWMCKRI